MLPCVCCWFVFLKLQPIVVVFFTAQYQALASSFSRFLDHTQRSATVGRTPLDEWSIRRRDLYLTTHNTHNRQTSMPWVGFEPTISTGERPKTYALDRAAAGTGCFVSVFVYIFITYFKICALLHFDMFFKWSFILAFSFLPEYKSVYWKQF